MQLFRIRPTPVLVSKINIIVDISIIIAYVNGYYVPRDCYMYSYFEEQALNTLFENAMDL